MNSPKTDNYMLFDIVESSNGVDNTFEVRCIGSDAIVAVFSYWEARDEAYQHAEKFADLLTQFYQNNWGEIELDGLVRSIHHHKRGFGEQYQ